MADETFVNSNSFNWVASPYPGVFRKPLRFEENGPRTSLLKMEPGGRIPPYLHPEGEELLILERRLQVDGDKWYEAGWYMHTPPGGSNEVYTDTGALLLVTLPKPHIDLV
ncbi:MAG: cupin domain-containing protein [Kiloniellales bacterium]